MRFNPYSIETATGQFATIIFAFALFPENYDGLVHWPFPKVVHLGLRDRLDPHNTWTRNLQPTLESPFRRPTSSMKYETFAVALYIFSSHSKRFLKLNRMF